MRLTFILTFHTLLLASPSFSARILSLSFYGTKSHTLVYYPLLHELASRGHEVTIVNPIIDTKNFTNIKYIQTLPIDLLKKDSSVPNMFEVKESYFSSMLSQFLTPFYSLGPSLDKVCRQSYTLPQIQQLIHSGPGSYDLIIFSSALNECLYGLVHHLNTPVIVINQMTVFPWISGTMGNPTPPSFVPNVLYGFSDSMNFFERVFNFVSYLSSYVVKTWIYDPKMEKIYREMINKDLPGISQIEGNSSLVFCNSHISFTRPKPLTPDIIDVGGLHLKKPKPLPSYLQEFVEGSGEDGFILFSMGSSLKGSDMPEKYRKIILKTFSKLTQRVIWKWESEEMEDLPKNVKLSKWLPQQDVLGHEKCVLFITHGGHGSTQEAIFNGVPIVGLPMFADQQYNMQQARRLGFGIPLDFTRISEEVFGEAIQQVLYEPKYRETAQKLSALFHDQIDDPLQRAVYHTEFVLRHQGARHLRSAARDLSIFEYYSLDVISTLLLALSVIIYLNLIILRKILHIVFSSEKGSQKNLRREVKTIKYL